MRRELLLFCFVFACNTDSFVTDDGGADAPSDNVVGGGGDGSIDAPAKDVVTKPLRFCEKVDAQFCADFDIPNDAGAGFASPPLQSNGWLAEFVDASTTSLPKAFASIAPGDAGGVAALQNAQMAPGFDAGILTHVTLDMELYLPGNLLNTSQPVFAFQLGVNPSPLYVFGLAHEGFWMLERGNGSGVAMLNPQPAANEWGKLTLSIDIGVGASAITVDLVTSSGTSHASLTLPTEPDSGPPTWPGFLSIGGQTVSPVLVPATFQYDNVVVRWQ